MHFQGVQPEQTTLAAGKQIHAVSLKADFHFDNFVANGLIGVHLKCRKTELAESTFYKMLGSLPFTR